MTDTINWGAGPSVPWDEGVATARLCVGPGWGPLVQTLMEDLRAEGWDGLLLQVKEKFGGLRFYTGPLTQVQEDLVRAAENRSYEVCEICGEPGRECDEFGWIRTLCEACRVRRRSEV